MSRRHACRLGRRLRNAVCHYRTATVTRALVSQGAAREGRETGSFIFPYFQLCGDDPGVQRLLSQAPQIQVLPGTKLPSIAEDRLLTHAAL